MAWSSQLVGIEHRHHPQVVTSMAQATILQFSWAGIVLTRQPGSIVLSDSQGITEITETPQGVQWALGKHALQKKRQPQQQPRVVTKQMGNGARASSQRQKLHPVRLRTFIAPKPDRSNRDHSACTGSKSNRTHRPKVRNGPCLVTRSRAGRARPANGGALANTSMQATTKSPCDIAAKAPRG